MRKNLNLKSKMKIIIPSLFLAILGAIVVFTALIELFGRRIDFGFVGTATFVSGIAIFRIVAELQEKFLEKRGELITIGDEVSQNYERDRKIAMGIIEDAKKKASDIISQANRDAESVRKNSQQSSVDAKTIINNAKNSAENVVKNAKNDAESVINSAYKEAARIKQEIQEEFWKSPEGRSVMAEERMYEIRKKEREEIAKLTKQLADEELRRNIDTMKRMQEMGN